MKIAFVGAGMIGAGLAVNAALKGHQVSLYDVAPPETVQGTVRGILDSLTEAGAVDAPAASAALAGMSFTQDLAQAVTGARLVQECVPERLELKQATYRSIQELVGAEPVEIPERFPFYSLVNITGTARGITETGCKFPLDNGEIHCGYQYGTSNEVLPGQTAESTVKEGRLLLIEVRRP